LETASALFPRWTVSSNMSGGIVRKLFRRELDDLASEHIEDKEFHGMKIMKRDAYLNFTDPEYFDATLLSIFDSWNGSGETGSNHHFIITSEDTGPITYHDIYCVSQAEKYLYESGYVVPEASEELIQS
jgi:hypothetical protein